MLHDYVKNIDNIVLISIFYIVLYISLSYNKHIFHSISANVSILHLNHVHFAYALMIL